MIHWFIANVYPTALRTLIASLIGAGVANLIVGPIRKEARRARRAAAEVTDHLDPSTPGGIAPMTAALQKIADELDTATPGGITDLLKAMQKLDADEEGMDDGADPAGHAHSTHPMAGARVPGIRR